MSSQESEPANSLPPSGSPRARSGVRNRLIVLGVLVAGTAVAIALFSGWRKGPPGTRKPPPESSAHDEVAPLPVLSTSPFLNTKPGVAYIGDHVCLECHAEYKSYHGHPMGHSLFRTAEAPPLERIDEKATFRSGPFRFQVLREGNKQIHREWCEDARGNVVAEQRVAMSYTVGAGVQARTYLYERDGFLFESPITWFTQKGEWHLSPGYESNQFHFTRRIDSRCLFCHAQQARPIEYTANRYQDPPFAQLAIGCERCHGPGELHASPSRPLLPRGEVDYTIVNPRHLSQSLREEICTQCHLQGMQLIARRGRSQYEYRPGLPLDEYVNVFLRPPEFEDPTRIVGHTEQMRQSACYTKSEGRFGCTTCHDPHRAPPPAAEAPAYYQRQCQKCHAASEPSVKPAAPDCSLPPARRVAKDGRADCLACHMPRSPSATQHVAVTDHRLLRRLDRPRSLRSPLPPGTAPFISFSERLAPPDPEWERDIAIAAVSHAMQGGATRQARADLVQGALPLLDRAVLRDPTDVPALEARGLALLHLGDLTEALRVFEDVLARAPEHEQALSCAAEIALALGSLDLAEAYARRLTGKYPHYPLYQESLAAILSRRGAWPQALTAVKAAVRGDPFSARSRELLIEALLETGDLKQARAEFDAVGVIDPAYQPKLRERFGSRLGLAR